MIVLWALLFLVVVAFGVAISHFWGTKLYNKTEGFINTYKTEETEKEKENHE